MRKITINISNYVLIERLVFLIGRTDFNKFSGTESVKILAKYFSYFTGAMSTLEEIEIKNIDHLGIVAGIIDSIGLVETVNNLVGEDISEKISSGHVVKAMILNGLGFVSAPLYMFS